MQPPHDISTHRHADAYTLSIHDQARSHLRTVVFEWDRVADYLGPGDRFVVTTPTHCCVGIQGVITSERPNLTFDVILDRAVDGRTEGVLRRADIKRIGFNRKVGYPMTTQHRHMVLAHNQMGS